MDGISALRNWIGQHLASWMGKGSGSTWIVAGTLAFAGGSAALLSPTPVHSRVVQVPSSSAQQTVSFTLDYTLPRHHCHGAEDGAY
ncbi:MAG TPA: hypothetical protein VN837_05830 [Chloroflexota bacterium]|nr:hypothetical protein [Chloroflexota bacterium]